jgi:hypothetical protein
MRNDDIHGNRDQLSRELGCSLALPVSEADIKLYIPTLSITQILQTSAKPIWQWVWWRGRDQYADPRHPARWLLCMRRERPADSRSAQE